ncbi:MAG: ATP-dependent dethiobiotin synthetase BioD [Acidimicrobiia bacterium]
MTTTVFVTGTGTEVGKTWWSVELLRELGRDGIRAIARKPAQSFAARDGRTDADLLAAASSAEPTRVCPHHRWYEAPLAPPMAAAELGRPAFTIADLVAETIASDEAELLLVEGAGGPRSPLADDGDNVDFAGALSPDAVLLVADAGLGTINAVRLAAAPFRELGLPLIVALNRFGADPLHEQNNTWLRSRYGFDTVTDPGVLATRWATGSVAHGISQPGKRSGQ